MNICFLEGDMTRRGGTERMTALLANKLAETDTVSVVSLSFGGGEIFFQLKDDVKHDVVPKGKIPSVIAFLRKYLQMNHIDYLVNVDIGTCIYGIPACMGTKTRVITWEHSNYYNNWGSRWFPYFRRFAAKCSDVLVVLTEKDKKNYQHNIPSRKPVVVIPNPAERHNFRYDAMSKVIVSAGLLLPIKGYDLAIQAAAKVLPQHSDWKWLICGEGPDRGKLEKLIAQHGLEKQVQLLGTVYNMPEKYQKAAFYVMTSKIEGLPMVLLEAKSWGLPIVSFDIMTGPSDIVRDGVNGFLVETDDVDVLACSVEKLISSQELRVRFSENSQLDMERFDFERIVERWKEILK